MTISHRFPLVSHGLSWFLCFPVKLHDLLPAGLLSAAYETRFAVDLQLQVPQLWWHRRHILPDHLSKHWQSIGKVIWMRHRACGWHAACCFCRFLQGSDETQAETCDKKEQEITRWRRKYNQETWMVENLSPNALGSKLLKAVSFCTLMHSIKTSASGGGSCLIATWGTILQLRSWFSNHLEW